ncbi:MAG: ubiquitin-like domain-containing protein [Candidatus Saccharimonadales bacterium]
MIPILTFFGLCLVTGGGFLLLNRGQPKFQPITSYVVLLAHDHQKQVVPTNEPTIGDLLHKLNITLAPGDRIEPTADTPIAQDNLRVNIYRAVPVQIIQNGQSTFALNAGTTPRSIAEEAGIKLYPEDNITVAQVENFLTQHSLGKQVIIDPATPVNLNVYGTPTVVRTHAATVGELLKQKKITIRGNDSVQPGPDTVLTPNALVYLIHSGTQIVTETQTISEPTQTIHDSSLSFGTSAVRQAGSPGQQVVTYQINTQNGKEVSRTLIQTVVTVQPVTQIVAQGDAVSIPADKQAVMAQAGIAPGDYAYVDYIMSHEGGWCPTKWQGEHTCPGYYVALHPESSGFGYGIGQATPASKMAGFGSDWRTNVVTQLHWATSYAVGRYGSWGAAYNRWSSYHNW